MTATSVLLVRHGRSTWNEAGRWQGWADAPLSPEGETEIVLAARRLEAGPINMIASSDLARAQRTAELLADALGLGAVIVDPGLRERNAGDWTGLTRVEIESRWPGALEAYYKGKLSGPPGGESTADFVSRAIDALARLRDTASDRVVLGVTHSGLIRALERHLGEATAPVANLSGRWVTWRGNTLYPGERVALLDGLARLAAPPTTTE